MERASIGTRDMPKRLTRRQQAFLEAYRTWGFIKIAADKSNVSRELHYNAMRVSETYRDAFAAIELEQREALIQQARELSLQGPIAPVYYSRKIVGFRLKPDIRLLMKQLRQADPKKFCFRQPRRRKPDSERVFQGFSFQRIRRSDTPESGQKPDSEGVFRLSRFRTSWLPETRNSQRAEEIRQPTPSNSELVPMDRAAGRPPVISRFLHSTTRPLAAPRDTPIPAAAGAPDQGRKPDSEGDFGRRANDSPRRSPQPHLHDFVCERTSARVGLPAERAPAPRQASRSLSPRWTGTDSKPGAMAPDQGFETLWSTLPRATPSAVPRSPRLYRFPQSVPGRRSPLSATHRSTPRGSRAEQWSRPPPPLTKDQKPGLPNTAHWRRSNLSATHRPTPPQSSGTLASGMLGLPT